MPADDLSNEQYALCQAHLLTIGAIVRDMPLEAFLARLERTDAVAAILDPTLARAAGAHLELVKRMATALQNFKATLPTLEQALELDARRQQYLNSQEQYPR